VQAGEERAVDRLSLRRTGGVGEAAADGDHAPGEVALVELANDAVDGDGGVAADAPAIFAGTGS
jgi:hypothetical protein